MWLLAGLARLAMLSSKWGGGWVSVTGFGHTYIVAQAEHVLGL